MTLKIIPFDCGFIGLCTKIYFIHLCTKIYFAVIINYCENLKIH